MPGRSWGSGSSSSSSSSRSSSSSSSSSSHSSYHSSSSGDGEPADPATTFFWLGVLAVILVGWFVLKLVNDGNEARKNTDATATTHSVTVADLAMMHAALDSQLSRWRELGKTTATHVGAESAGFSKSSNTREVVYGYCDDDKTQFYVYVLNERPPQNSFIADTEGYAWIKNSNPSACHPAEWRIHDYVRVSEEAGWYFGLMTTQNGSRFSTQPGILPGIIATPTPVQALTEF